MRGTPSSTCAQDYGKSSLVADSTRSRNHPNAQPASVNCVTKRGPVLWHHDARSMGEASEMRSSTEVSIDLSTEELLQDSRPSGQLETHEVSVVGTPPPATQTAPNGQQAETSNIEDAIEIELTAEQIDALLSGNL